MGSKIYVGGLPYSTTEQQLSDLLATQAGIRLLFQDAVAESEDGFLRKIHQRFKHARLAGEMTVECGFGYTHGTGQCGCGYADAGPGFQFLRKYFQDLLTTVGPFFGNHMRVPEWRFAFFPGQR